jgi:hypothetical protein
LAEERKKYLGAQVDESFYWKVKAQAALRGKEMKELIVEALTAYLDLDDAHSEALAAGDA